MYMSLQAVKVSQLDGNTVYQTVSSVCWPTVKVTQLLGMLCTYEQGLPDYISHKVLFVLLYLASSPPVCSALLLQPTTTGDCPRSASLNKSMSCTQHSDTWCVLWASGFSDTNVGTTWTQSKHMFIRKIHLNFACLIIWLGRSGNSLLMVSSINHIVTWCPMRRSISLLGPSSIK